MLHGKDLSDKVTVVTGANSGVGYQVARSLALQVILWSLHYQTFLRSRGVR